ncbi:hypothetical protein [Flavobacterium nackdongense]|uniref:Lipoprotein n=1 Tax=Flavobacterium nackdongense TaxID=2547394 RepID=A0A4V1AGV8_9FLAO|nr:hypothetical protein [Flavobacterium nackdongense]QBN19392.1 hypothetical protein E1750_11485 [Flavobacterium nackdongense]
MKFKYIYVFLLIFSLFSCKNENEIRQAESIKDIKKKELIFLNIDKNWKFNAKPINSASQSQTVSWKEWRSFLAELEQKPKKTIGAFQKKSAELSKKVMALNVFLPAEYNNPQMKSRIAILITKVRMLDLYLHLKDMPEKKIVALLPEINIQLVALQNQMDKIDQKSKIPLETGESELLKMIRDTARAIPSSSPLDPNTPRVE